MLSFFCLACDQIPNKYGQVIFINKAVLREKEDGRIFTQGFSTKQVPVEKRGWCYSQFLTGVEKEQLGSSTTAEPNHSQVIMSLYTSHPVKV